MGIATPEPTPASKKSVEDFISINSMSQGFHQGIFNLANGFNRSTARGQEEDQQMEPHQHRPLTMEEVDSGELPTVYESGGMTMLSEMFNFQSASTTPPTGVLENHVTENYRLQQRPSTTTEWYGSRHGMVEGLGSLVEAKHHQNSNNQESTSGTMAHRHQHHISSLNANSATAMQLFLMNPQPRSPSPTSATTPTSPPLHFLLPNQSNPVAPLQGYPQEVNFGGTPIPQTQFTWMSGSTGGENTGTQQLYGNHRTGGGVDSQVQVLQGQTQGHGQGQGLSLSLSSLQHLEAVKAEEMRMGDAGMVYFNQGSSSSFQMKNLASQYQQPLQLQGISQNQNHQIHVGYSSSYGVINLLRNSKFTKPAQELLEEFCSVGRGHIKNHMKIGRHNKNPNNANQGGSGGGSSRGGESSSTKEIPPLSATDKIEYQRKKASLLSMLDEVDRRYNNYCEQMQMVVNSYDSVMGHGAASPYTVLAQKAMSRHFRCLKDAIVGQLKTISELVGDKDGIGSTGITKGETPRLKLLDQSLRQQRAFQQMGIMEQEAWRPQRGLPERSVTILRAWLFEHFLHPYPSDADKHLLARQTGLSRNQVSNWFINARVRLWKPMVEEMYQQESKDNEEVVEENNCAQAPMPCQVTTTTATTATTSRRSQIDAFESDVSLNAINRQCFSENQATVATPYSDASPTGLMHRYHQAADDGRRGGGGVEYGTTSATGDVSLTLGLQHAGNVPDSGQFSVSDYGSC